MSAIQLAAAIAVKTLGIKPSPDLFSVFYIWWLGFALLSGWILFGFIHYSTRVLDGAAPFEAVRVLAVHTFIFGTGMTLARTPASQLVLVVMCCQAYCGYLGILMLLNAIRERSDESNTPRE